MLIKLYENWNASTDNGIWQNPKVFSTVGLTKAKGRARLIDDIIYIVPSADSKALPHKIRLSDYSDAMQDKIIDSLYKILE